MFDCYATYGLRGQFDVAQTARVIARYHYVEAQLMRIMAGKLADLPEWEAKCLLGRHLWQDSLHADCWLQRLSDLRWPRKAPLHPGVATLDVMALLDGAPDTATFFTAVYRLLKPRLLAGYTHHLNRIAPLADEPTAILLQQNIAEEQTQIREGLALLDTLPAQPERRAIAWLDEIEPAIDRMESFGLPGADAAREVGGHFEGQQIRPAPPIAARDGRFRLENEGFGAPVLDTLEPAKLMAHRDADNEMHAAEVLGRNLYEQPTMPWQYHLDMARQCWDEVRHAVLYQKYLEELGGHLGDFPVVPGNYAYRMQLDFQHRLYDLHLRGEKLGMPDLIRMREQARVDGDVSYALLNDFVHADEVPHVKNGRWLYWLLKDDLTTFQQIERETMQHRAAYEQAHANDPLLRAYTGLSAAILSQSEE